MKSKSGHRCGQVSARLLPLSITPRTMRRKWVRGMTSPIAWAQPGMPRNGNMKPDSSSDGRKKKKVSCIGYVQVAVILGCARWLFEVPFVGSGVVLMLATLVFIAANLTVGITISSAARNQTQAMQLTFFFFLPSLLLSGFMFPFRGMPGWAQAIGEAMPLTHFLRIVRGVMLKGSTLPETWPHLWPLLLFTAIVLAIGLKRFRRTLD